MTEGSHAEMLKPLHQDIQKLVGLGLNSAQLEIAQAMVTNPWIWHMLADGKVHLGPYYNHVKIADVAAVAMRHEALIRAFWKHLDDEHRRPPTEPCTDEVVRTECPTCHQTVEKAVKIDPTDYRMNLELFFERMRSCVK